MPRPRRFAGALAVFALSFCLGSCRAGGETGPEPSAAATPETATSEAARDRVPWFEGSVDEAFAAAAAADKPVFLYWGAVWCPPCHYLREKLFQRPEFLARMESVVPVYLDGDTERAQILGERYQTKGYPTVIVFDSGGQEVMRIDSMLPVEQYAAALDTALDATKPIAEVLAAVDSVGPAAMAPADLNLLAFYAWGQEHGVELDGAAKAKLFGRLFRETPTSPELARSRFLALYLPALAGAGEGGKPAALPASERAALDGELRRVLAEPRLRNVNLGLLIFESAPTVELLRPEPGPERDALIAALDTAARAVEADESLTVDDRLGALGARVALAGLVQGEGKPLPPALLEHVRERIAWATKEVTDENELQAAMNVMVGVLINAHLHAEARELPLAHMADTVAPYYYRSYLAGFEEESGNHEAAVALYRQAWLEPEGSATRFR
jgi:thiol-disulfide isomerase/thioredoxin